MTGEGKKFLLVKDSNDKEVVFYDYKSTDGYKLKAKKKQNFMDTIQIDEVIIIKPSLIDKMVNKKISKKFERLINMIQIVCDNEDDDATGEGYRIALNEAEKFKMELWNKYKKFLSKQKLDLMTKKIEILEDELKLRLNVLMDSFGRDDELNKGRGR